MAEATKKVNPAVKATTTATAAKASTTETKTTTAKAATPAKKAVAPAKKTTAKKTTAKKTTAKKSTAKKTTTKKTVESIHVQFDGREYESTEVIKMCKDAFKANNKRKAIDEIAVYVNANERIAYYVVKSGNEEISSNVPLYE